MVRFDTHTLRVSEILKWNRDKTLILKPELQRRSVWKPAARAYLIDTILKDLPIPKIFMRISRDPKTQLLTQEIVDGQQRFRSVLDFKEGKFETLTDEKNKELSGLTFKRLPRQYNRVFVRYKFAVDILKDAKDEDVYDLFRRLNRYTYRLSRHEMRNGMYFGPLKRTVYRLSEETKDFWKKNRIFSETTISRMTEAELISELLVVMLDGLQDKKEKPLRTFYSKYEAERSFAEREQCVARFKHCLNVIKEIFGEKLKESEFRKRSLFYSLYCVILDALYVMPKSKVNKRRRKISLETLGMPPESI